MALNGSSRPKLPHVPALDGVRGLAVVAVLLFHGGVSWASGGFLGVDAFFVLSGFLITTLLLLEVYSGHGVGLRGFWSRRVRRLLPALLLVVAAVGAYAAFVAPADMRGSIRLDALAALGYVANWRFVAVGGDYFAHAALPSPLLHTWSLAIEEQFYLLFPLAVLLASRARRPGRVLAVGAAVLAVVSAVLMAAWYVPGGDTSRLYYGTDTHAQSVLIGVALAAFLAWRRNVRGYRNPGWFVRVIGPVGLVGAVVLAGTLNGGSPTLYRGGFFVFGLAIAAVLTHVVALPRGWMSRSLGWEPVAVVGRVSYGVYLWHWPVYLTLTNVRTGLSGPGLLAARIAATAAVSALSYHLVEMPVRRGILVDRRPLRLAAAPVALALTAVLVVTATTQFTPEVPASARTSTAAAQVPAPAPAPKPDALTVARRPPPPPGAPVRVLLEGDSVALTLAQGLRPVARRYGVDLVDRSRLGCGVMRGSPFRYFGQVQDDPPECGRFPMLWQADLAATDPDVVLVIVGRWEVMDRVLGGEWTHLGLRDFDRQLRTRLDRAVQVMAARGAPVVLTTAPYFMRGERPDGGRWPEDDPARVDRFNEIVREVAAENPGVATVVDFGGKLSPRGALARVIDGVRVRSSDGVHITLQGGRWLAPWLLPQVTALMRPGEPAAAELPPATSRRGATAPTTVRPPR